MGPEKWKGERPADEATERDHGSKGEQREGERGSAKREAIEDREDEGWGQPESSAQKMPPPGPGEDDVSRE